MRKQYSFWPGEDGLDAWDVDRLVELSALLPIVEVPLESIWEVDTVYWFGVGNEPPTVRNVIDHMRLVAAVDVEYPIILGANGRVMDGMHRVARALLDGQASIPARRFEIDPPPDYRACLPEDLPYE